MERTISITELQQSDIGSWSVKDNSPRGCHTVSTADIKPGDKVVIDNYFITVTEAVEAEQARIFAHYKKRLAEDGWNRYNVVQYLCSLPEIDPDEMAAALMADGVRIDFDDTSISKAENNAHRRRVCKLLPVLDKQNARVGAAYRCCDDCQIVRRIYRISEDYARENDLMYLDRVETTAGDFALPGSDIFRG